jgi:hypothetical protein
VDINKVSVRTGPACPPIKKETWVEGKQEGQGRGGFIALKHRERFNDVSHVSINFRLSHYALGEIKDIMKTVKIVKSTNHLKESKN